MPLWSEATLGPIIAKRNASLLRKNDALLKTALGLVPKSMCHLNGITHLEKAVLLLVLTKGAKTFRAMNVVAATGLGADAMILLRTLVELRINLRYIRVSDSAVRAKKLFTFATVVSSWRYSVGGPADPALQRQCDEARAEFGPAWWDAAVRRSVWSVSIRAKAKEVGLLDLYDRVYARACEASHGSDIADHLDITKEGDFVPLIAPTVAWVPEVLTAGNGVFSDLLLDLADGLQPAKLAQTLARIQRLRAMRPAALI